MITRFLKIVGLGCALAAGSLPFGAKASDFFSGSVDGVDLGDSGDTYHWAVFSLAGNLAILDPTYNAGFNDVVGNIGEAGNGVLLMLNGRVQGNVWLHSGGFAGLVGGATITGSILAGSSTDAVLNQAVTDANSASAAANALVATAGSPSTISLVNSSLSISAGSTQNYVMHLTDFVLANSTVTLTGTASQHFIIDVSRNFALSNASEVNLSGGLTAQDVLFDVVGKNPAGVSLSGASSLSGIILASNRTVVLSGGSSDLGEVIGSSIVLFGSSQVRNPLISP